MSDDQRMALGVVLAALDWFILPVLALTWPPALWLWGAAMLATICLLIAERDWP